jgi:hypothetical protein
MQDRASGDLLELPLDCLRDDEQDHAQPAPEFIFNHGKTLARFGQQSFLAEWSLY